MTLITHPMRERRRSQLTFAKPSRTKQANKDECDINSIMRRFEKDGVVDHVNKVQGRYGDYSEIPGDYHAACNLVIEAQEMFLTIPAEIRAKFKNDPGEFLDFALDEENRDELKKLGLLKTTAPAETPQASPVSSETPGGPEAAPGAAMPPETNKPSPEAS